MRRVKVKKDELLEILRKNKETHVVDFDESVADFKDAVVKIAKDNLELVETGDLGSISKTQSFPRAPKSYESDYSKSIHMLELSVEDEIELEDDEFAQLVLDEWDWKRNFTSSKEMYMTLKR